MNNKTLLLTLCLGGSLLGSLTVYGGVNDGVVQSPPAYQQTYQQYNNAPTQQPVNNTVPYQQNTQYGTPSAPVQMQQQQVAPSYGSPTKTQTTYTTTTTTTPSYGTPAQQAMPQYGSQMPVTQQVTVPAPQVMAPVTYSAKYVYGNAPFDLKTKVLINRSNDSYVMTFTTKMGQQSWQLPIKSIRGAEVLNNGMWLYWFDANSNTLTAFFEMSQGVSPLVAEINAAVTQARAAPIEQYQQRFEAYKSQALQNAE